MIPLRVYWKPPPRLVLHSWWLYSGHQCRRPVDWGRRRDFYSKKSCLENWWSRLQQGHIWDRLASSDQKRCRSRCNCIGWCTEAAHWTSDWMFYRKSAVGKVTCAYVWNFLPWASPDHLIKAGGSDSGGSTITQMTLLCFSVSLSVRSYQFLSCHILLLCTLMGLWG